MAVDAVPPRRVLVAAELSQRSGHAVRRAVQLAGQHSASVTALHVVPPGTDPQLEEFAGVRLAAHTDEHSGSAAVENVVRTGRVSSVIAAEAVDLGADLVVVGAHGAHWLTDTLLGSTADSLVRESRTPVLVVRNPPDGAYRTVLLAVDATEVSFRAARIGGALAPGADHMVVHVSVVVGEHLMLMRGVDEAALAELRRVSTDRIRPRLEQLAAHLAPRKARVLIESGRPETALLELGDRHGADLIVVGTGTHSKPGYALLGSVAHHVMRRAKSDVLVARGDPQ